MYLNTAQLCLWPMTFIGLAGADMSLISTRDFWASVHPFLHYYLTPGSNGSILIIFVVGNYLCGALAGVVPSFSLYFRSVP